jgi:hypothetical protein
VDADGEEEALQGRCDHQDRGTMKRELAVDIDFNDDVRIRPHVIREEEVEKLVGDLTSTGLRVFGVGVLVAG